MSDTIVVGTDGSSQAAVALEWAADLARRLGAGLLVVHVFETDPSNLPGGSVILSENDLARMKEQCGASLEKEWTEPARRAGADYSCELPEGNAAEILIDLAELRNAKMRVVEPATTVSSSIAGH